MTIRRHSFNSRFVLCCCGVLGAAQTAAIHAAVTTNRPFQASASGVDDPNEELAVVRLLQMKVDRGDADAMNGLGMMYALGRGVAQNYQIALHLFRRAASKDKCLA